MLDIIISQVVTHSQWQYIYTDGNNNQWYISPQRLEYRPVSAVESGSGLYSGGEQFTVKLKPSQYNELVTLIKSAIRDTRNQTTKRQKGDSAVTIAPDQSGKRVIFFKRDSLPQRQIQLGLQKLKPSP